MAGVEFIAAATGAASPGGVAKASWGAAVARAADAASERHRSSFREDTASVRTNAPTTSPHKSIRLPTSAPTKKPQL
jgi:hypothetical protein